MTASEISSELGKRWKIVDRKTKSQFQKKATEENNKNKAETVVIEDEDTLTSVVDNVEILLQEDYSEDQTVITSYVSQPETLTRKPTQNKLTNKNSASMNQALPANCPPMLKVIGSGSLVSSSAGSVDFSSAATPALKNIVVRSMNRISSSSARTVGISSAATPALKNTVVRSINRISSSSAMSVGKTSAATPVLRNTVARSTNKSVQNVAKSSTTNLI